ncbi:hypothetical protein K435DRAFT_852774 [Dendrothele bispora CBS 962.96]|uniref:Uncharacterized protein n=1 Tax=Dendrothele bispora (strain CBS 962.96) TaxID=1314807 RepID=A0A4S8MIH6_DENBC|nr:hypothetical protein K435DRAFT_852774 [Dendrothele bispora CBS 962.96]
MDQDRSGKERFKTARFPYPQITSTDWRVSCAAWNIPSESEILIEHFEREGWTTLDNIQSMLLGFDTTALVWVAADTLGLLPGKEKQKDPMTSHSPLYSSSPQVRLHSTGAFNQVYVITFPSATTSATGQSSSLQVVARLPKLDQSLIPPNKLESVVATMTFSRNCRELPVPKVLTWNPYYDVERNPVLRPYILMEFVPGISLLSHWIQLCSQPSGEREKTKEIILNAVAALHVRLSEPLPSFSGDRSMLGSIYFDWEQAAQGNLDLRNPNSYCIGALAHGYGPLKKRRYDAISLEPVGPAEDLPKLWRMCVCNELQMVSRTGVDILDGSPCRDASIDRLKGQAESGLPSNLGLIHELGIGMERWVDHCPLPSKPSLLSPCFVMDDWAFRNIIVDPSTSTLCSIVDWDDAYILPFILSGNYPEDLCPTYVDKGDDHSARWDFLPEDENLLVMPFPLPDMLRPNENMDQSRKMESHEHVLDWVQMNERIECTIWRRIYREKLAALDSRFLFSVAIQGTEEAQDLDGFWEIRQEPMKVQKLLLYGWQEWIEYRLLIEKDIKCDS